MTDPGAVRSKYFEEIEKAVEPHLVRSFEYEKQAINYSNEAFKVLTYLNGGALVAIPAAVALFQTDIPRVKTVLMLSAMSFVAGLLLVVGAQACAFFTMAKRAESEAYLSIHKKLMLGSVHYPDTLPPEKTAVESNQKFATASAKLASSNTYRTTGLVLFWASIIVFVLGCAFGSRAMLA